MKGYHYWPICLKTQGWEGVEFEEEKVYKMTRCERERETLQKLIQFSLMGLPPVREDQLATAK